MSNDDKLTTEPDRDIAALNVLLTAEFAAIAAHATSAGLITGAGPGDPLYPLREVIVAVLEAIQSQHEFHAAALMEAVQVLGGSPVAVDAGAASFEPPDALAEDRTIANVLRLVASAERSAALAYDQVVAGIESTNLRFLASAIECAESQHFIVFAALLFSLIDPGAPLDQSAAANVRPASESATTA